MTDLEHDILAALVELDLAVKSFRTANPKPNLQPVFQRLERLAEEMPRGSDPSLLHYLHKKSYEKARLFLEGRDAENPRGECRRD